MMEYKDLPDIKSIYDCPISTTISQIHSMINQSYTDQVLKAIKQIGIEINEQGLVEAINNDRRRYEAAYQKGWDDCQEHYKHLADCEEKLNKIAEIIGNNTKT